MTKRPVQLVLGPDWAGENEQAQEQSLFGQGPPPEREVRSYRVFNA